jgi:hypothetical protein
MIIYKFRYYYLVTDDYEPVWSAIGHIKIRDSLIFLCGIEQPADEPFNVQKQALPGRKICEKCLEERDRLTKGTPTAEQIKIWWNGGLQAHRKEMEIIEK